jgi:hypothetical protein
VCDTAARALLSAGNLTPGDGTCTRQYDSEHGHFAEQARSGEADSSAASMTGRMAYMRPYDTPHGMHGTSRICSCFSCVHWAMCWIPTAVDIACERRKSGYIQHADMKQDDLISSILRTKSTNANKNSFMLIFSGQ